MAGNRYRKGGFTLIELSLVLLILSLLAAGLLTVANIEARRSKQALVQAKLDVLEQAFFKFARLNSRLPCPADGTLAITSQYFGIEGVNAGACTTGSTYDGNGKRTAAASPGPTANFTYTNSGKTTVGGVVPVKTLGLPEDAMFDPWGGEFTYAVDILATGTSAFSSANYPVTNTVIGNITVTDSGGNNRTTAAVMILVSHGPDGHGAYQLSGTRKATGSTNSGELANCHCDATAATNVSQPFNATFTQRLPSSSYTDPLNTFDDIVRYYTRGAFNSATDASLTR